MEGVLTHVGLMSKLELWKFYNAVIKWKKTLLFHFGIVKYTYSSDSSSDF